MIQKLFKKLISLLLIISFFPFSSLAMLSDDDEGQIAGRRTLPLVDDVEEVDIEPDKKKKGEARRDNDDLIQSFDETKPLIIRALGKKNLNSPLKKQEKELKRTVEGRELFTSAALAYDRLTPKVSLQVLTNLDDILFDESVEPRWLIGQLIKCCYPSCCCCSNGSCFKSSPAPFARKVLEGAITITGAAGVCNNAIPLTNYVVLMTLNADPLGWVPKAIFGIAPAMNATTSLCVYYVFGKWLVEKKQSFLLAKNDRGEEQDNRARVFETSKLHRFLQVVHLGASVSYTLMPFSVLWGLLHYFPVRAAIFSPPTIIYFADPYARKGLNVLNKEFAKRFYITHASRLTRKALCTAMNELRTAVEKDKDGTITNRLYKALQNRTGKFGKEVLDDIMGGEIHSALSILCSMSKVINLEDQDDLVPYANTFINMSTIPEKSVWKEVSSHLATYLLVSNFWPGFLMESYSVSWMLSSFPGVSPEAAEISSYLVASVFSTRAFVEQGVQKQAIRAIVKPKTPDRLDHIGARRTSNTWSMVYGLTGLLFTSLYWASSGSTDMITRVFFAICVTARYFLLFYNMANDSHNRVITDFGTRHVKKPTLNQKKAKIYDLIERAKKTVSHELTNETIMHINKGLFNAQ